LITSEDLELGVWSLDFGFWGFGVLGIVEIVGVVEVVCNWEVGVEAEDLFYVWEKGPFFISKRAIHGPSFPGVGSAFLDYNFQKSLWVGLSY